MHTLCFATIINLVEQTAIITKSRKQHKIITLLKIRSPNIKAEVCFFLESWGGSLSLCLFRFPEAAYSPSIFKAIKVTLQTSASLSTLFPSSHLLPLLWVYFVPLIGPLVIDYFGTTCVIHYHYRKPICKTLWHMR